jgi:hypothetical protein
MSRTATISKNGTNAPVGHPGYSLGGLWVWVEYPALGIVGEQYATSDAYDGFAIEVLMNPTGQAEHDLKMALRRHIRRLQDLGETDPDNQEAVDASEDAYLQVVAPRVRNWNAEQDGVHVPAPGETNEPNAWQAFHVIPEHLKYWVTQVVREIAVPKRRTPASSTVGTGAIATPSVTPPDPEAPTS